MDKGQVFLVDDDEGFRSCVADILRHCGFPVSEWSDPRLFLDSIPAGRPAVVVTDMKMPSLAGVDLHIALLRANITIPVVYISGQSTAHQAIQALRLGAFDFLAKPFRRSELLATLSAAIEQDRRDLPEAATGPRHAVARDSLTPRERQVMGLMVQGLGNREIMTALGIALPTAKQYKSEVMRKTGSASLADLMRMARHEQRVQRGQFAVALVEEMRARSPEF